MLQPAQTNYELRTIRAVARRTTGNTRSSVGNPMIHDMNQAPSQMRTKWGAIPMPRNVLIAETMHVMKMDNSKGMTSEA